MRGSPVNDLLKTIHSDHFIIDLFKSSVKHVNGYMGKEQLNKEKATNVNRFQDCTLHKNVGSLTVSAVQYRQNVRKVLHDQFSSESLRIDLKFRPGTILNVQFTWQNDSVTCP